MTLGLIFAILLIYFIIGILILGFTEGGFSINNSENEDDLEKEGTQILSTLLFWPLYIVYFILRGIYKCIVLFFKTTIKLFKEFFK